MPSGRLRRGQRRNGFRANRWPNYYQKKFFLRWANSLIKRNNMKKRKDPTLEQIGELMNELDAYHHRTVVIKIGGNSIAEDDTFLSKIARQGKVLRPNGVRG